MHVASRAEWRAWLEENHAASGGIWLVRWKKSAGQGYVPYDEMAEEALCFGWIDSTHRPFDEERTQILVTPRKVGSRWSAVNKERVERLTAAGLMRPAGATVIEAAKADGAWNALDEVEALVEPPDLTVALAADPVARSVWDGFPPSARKAILQWVSDARTAPTRERRIATVVGDAHEGRRANQWRRPT